MALGIFEQAFRDANGRDPYPSEMPPDPIVAEYLLRHPPGQRGMHLGCGGAPFPGWLNIDSAWPWHLDILWDLSQGVPMAPDGAFDAVYSEHFMEHIPRKVGLDLLVDCQRALHKGGVIRIAMPDLDDMVKNYVTSPALDARVEDLQDTGATLYGEPLRTRGEWLNVAMRSWGHTYIYNAEDLGMLLTAAGFVEARRMDWRMSDNPWLANRETRDATQSTLIMEAVKP